MTPQSAFMIIAPVTEGKLDDLRSLLSSMNKQPGMANPNNELVPFSQFNRLHFARFFILEDNTEKNIKDYGLEFLPGQQSWYFSENVTAQQIISFLNSRYVLVPVYDGFFHTVMDSSVLKVISLNGCFSIMLGPLPTTLIG